MTEINPKIFRAYDIRGIYPFEINENVAEIIGKSLVRFLRKKSPNRKLKLVIGRDNRASSPFLFSALKRGILEQGQDVIDIGLVPTPMFYFAVWNFGFDGGIMLTASHNPPKYNGFKIVEKEAKMLGENTGLKGIKEISLKLEKERRTLSLQKLGRARKKSVLKNYLKFNLLDLNIRNLKKLKIVIDTGNAVSGILIRELKKYLPCKIYHLFPKLIDNFPNHLPNPLEDKNIKDLKKMVQEKKADLGVAFDGDGDRIIFIDEKGRKILPDFITCLISKVILREKKKGKIVYNICSSNIIPEVVEENGGEAIPWRIGHTFVKEKMKSTGAIFAGEYSGHYFLRTHHFCEAPLFILFKILEEITISKKSISELLLPFKKYFNSGQINLEVENKKEKLKKLERKYKRGKVSSLDGLRVDFSNWWFNARPSNTEDLLRVVVEAENKSLMRDKLKEITNFIKGK